MVAHGFGHIVHFDIYLNAPSSLRERHVNLLHVRSLDEHKQAGTIVAETRELGSEKGIVKCDSWITLYILVSVTMQRNSKEQAMCTYIVDGQAPPLSQRPWYQEAEEN